MDLSRNLQDSFDFAKKMSEDAGRWIILIILSIIPIVNFITIGYAAKVIKETPSSKTPPKLEGYVDLWIQGLKVLVAGIIYMIIPMIIFGVGAAAFIGTFLGAGMWKSGQGLGRWFAWPLMGITGIVGAVAIIVAFIFAIIAVMGIVHMIKNDQFGKAFAFKEITEIIKGIGWGTYILWLIVIFVINMIYSAIGNIPWIGWLITLILIPFYLVFIARSIGLTYSGQK